MGHPMPQVLQSFIYAIDSDHTRNLDERCATTFNRGPLRNEGFGKVPQRAFFKYNITILKHRLVFILFTFVSSYN
jgi:hypothetical protein